MASCFNLSSSLPTDKSSSYSLMHFRHFKPPDFRKRTRVSLDSACAQLQCANYQR